MLVSDAGAVKPSEYGDRLMLLLVSAGELVDEVLDRVGVVFSEVRPSRGLTLPSSKARVIST